MARAASSAWATMAPDALSGTPPLAWGRRSAVSGGTGRRLPGGPGLARGERQALHVGAAALPGERHALVFGELPVGIDFHGEPGEAGVCLMGAGTGCRPAGVG